MSDIIKKFKKLLVKKENLTRNSYGKEFKAFLYCYTENNKYYSVVIHPNRNYGKEYIILTPSDNKIFKESFFEGEYFNGEFFITNIVKCCIKKFNIERLRLGIQEDAGYIYNFESTTFKEEWNKKNNECITKTVIKDDNHFEIYRIKDSGEIIRIKNIESSKKLKNLFKNFKERDIKLFYNQRFEKWEVCVN